MSFFPFFREIEGIKGLIVGGGKVALRKAKKLLPYGPRLVVIAPEILPEFDKMNVTLVKRTFCDSDITPDVQFVIAACDDEEQNRQISLLCSAQNIPVNVVDCPEYCTFLFPSLVKRGDLSVGISTSGASPLAAVWLREQIEALLPEHFERTLEWLKEQRPVIKEQIKEEAVRSRYLKQLFLQCMEEPHTGKSAGRVSLVGAGCGSRDWITVEGLSLLRICDVVVYDDLIDPGLLDEAPSYAERIYVGKRSHKPSTKQESIQGLLVKYAKQGEHVVRLKGGDPFVFGRGGEEIQYLNQHQIPWKVVPGISSAIAIPAEAGIPVTYRGVSRSVHIMTAHTRENVLRRDMEQLAELEGTLVFLMGLESLGTIVSILKEKGRDGSTPIAVLSGGNAANPYKVTGNLENILEKAKKERVTSPGIIVVGDVVALDLQNSVKLPLSDLKIGLTGTDDFQAKLRSKLLPLGAETVSLMQGRCEETGIRIPWGKITDSGDKWIVFTSVKGIRYFFQQCRKANIDNRGFAACKFAVIGDATRNELKKYGFLADICPGEYTSFRMAEELIRQRTAEEEVYLFCSAQGSGLLEEKLAERQIPCHRFDLYDTYFTCSREPLGRVDCVLFGSAGGVRALYQSGYRMEKGVRGICIGPVCGEAYRQCFQDIPVIAKTATVGAMAEVVLDIVKG